jgi:hypothetical protein
MPEQAFDIWTGYGYFWGNIINYALGIAMAALAYFLYLLYRKHPEWMGITPGAKITIWTTRRVARIAVLTALAIVGSYISLGPTVALDSLAGFFGAGYFGLLEGAITLALGCFISHFFKGIAAMIPIIWTSYPAMALAGASYAYLYRRFKSPINWVTAIVAAVSANTFGCLVPLVFVWGLAAMLPYFAILAWASFVNVVIATFLVAALQKVRRAGT